MYAVFTTSNPLAINGKISWPVADTTTKNSAIIDQIESNDVENNTVFSHFSDQAEGYDAGLGS